jgi:hypothetical protein
MGGVWDDYNDLPGWFGPQGSFFVLGMKLLAIVRVTISDDGIHIPKSMYPVCFFHS